MSNPGPPPGWYPDNAEPGLLRYWSGNEWTEQTSRVPPAAEVTPQMGSRQSTPADAETEASDQSGSADHSEEGLRPDIRRAWKAMPNRLGKRRDVKKLVEYLHDGETVEEMAGGRNGGNQGLLVATNRRALFVSEGVIRHSFEDFPYDRISSITSSRGLTFAKITVMAGGAARVIDQLEKSSAQRVADHIRAGVERAGRAGSVRSQQPAPPAPSIQPAPDGIMEQLQKLGDLKEKGILTDEEFAEKKAELLRRL